MNADQREILIKLYKEARPEVIEQWICRLSDEQLYKELIKEIKC